MFLCRRSSQRRRSRNYPAEPPRAPAPSWSPPCSPRLIEKSILNQFATAPRFEALPSDGLASRYQYPIRTATTQAGTEGRRFNSLIWEVKCGRIHAQALLRPQVTYIPTRNVGAYTPHACLILRPASGKLRGIGGSMRARILDQRAIVYSEPDFASPPVTQASPGEEVELGGLVKKFGKSWVPVKLASGQRGYLEGAVKIFHVKPVTLLQDQAEVFSEPSAASAVKARYKKN